MFSSLVFLGGGYTVNGNAIALTDGISNSNYISDITINAPLQLAASQSFGTPGSGVQLSLAGSIDLNGFDLSLESDTALVTGLISGMGGVNVYRATFSGTQTYTGPTDVPGVLQLDGAQLASAVILDGGYLYGDGSVGPLSVGTQGGHIVPYGQIHTGDLSLETSGNPVTMSFQLNGPTPGSASTDYRQLAVNGSVDLGTHLTAFFNLGFVPAVGQIFTVIDNDGSDPVSGAFTDLPEGTTLTLGFSQFQITYAGGDGNDVVLTCTANTNVWTGAVNDLWSEPGNWTVGVPNAGDVVTFGPYGASTTTNDLPAGTVFSSLVFLGGGYTVNGNAIALTDGISNSNYISDITINAPLQLAASQSFGTPGSGVQLSLAGSIDLNGFDLSLESDTALVTGLISGVGGVNVYRATFSGTHTYTGPTDVPGVLQLDGAQLASAVILDGGYLYGDGSVGPLSVGTQGGHIVPYGQIHTGDLSLETSGNPVTMSFQLNGPTPGSASTDYRQLAVNGSVDLGTHLTAFFNLGFVPAVGQIFTVIDNDGSDPVSGAFTDLPEGTTLTLGFSQFQITYAGGDGNDVVLTCTANTNVWTGAVNDLWSEPGNWTVGVPNAGDVVTFGPYGASTTTNDLPAGTVFSSLVFLGGGYTVNGNAIALTDGISNSNYISDITINAPLQLAASQSFGTPGSGVQLSLVGSIDLNGFDLSLESDTALVTGLISGVGGVNVYRATFSGTHTYTGPTDVPGVLQLDGAQLASAVILDGGYLYGDGSVGPLSVGTQGGHIVPYGQIHTGDLSLETSGNPVTMSFQLNGPTPGSASTDYRQLAVNGSVDLGTHLTAFFNLGFVPAVGQIFTVIDNDGSDPISGSFIGLPEGATLDIGGYPFTISYLGKGGTGNDVVLVSLSGDPSDHAPTANDDAYGAMSGVPLNVTAPGVLGNDTDPDLDALSVIAFSAVSAEGGSVSMNADGSFTYTSAPAFTGVDTFTYTIGDGKSGTDTATVTITVTPATPSATPTSTATPMATDTPAPTDTYTSTPTNTATPTSTATPMATDTPTPTGTYTSTPTSTPTGTSTPTSTPPSICGDGIVVAGEECDDHNPFNGDGCSPFCTVETGWDCSGSPSVCTPTCGDGIVLFPKIITQDSSGATGEQCDDANLTDGDGCDSNCDVTPANETVAAGGTVTTDISAQGATAALPVQAYVTTPDGGTVSINVENGIGPAPTGFELLGVQFDVTAPFALPTDPLTLTFLIHESVVPPGVDINSIQLFKDGVIVPACTGPPGVASPDPCVVDRQYSGGVFQITALSSTASIWSFGFPICNDGIVEDGEQCDDGNYTDGDGCSYSCEVETGWDCSGSPSSCMPACGDGIVLFPKVITQDSSGSTGEQCDDGNLNDGDGCDSNCDFTPVSETVGAGGTVTTDVSGQGATAELPVQTYVTTPDGGTISITVENGIGPAPTGYEALGVQFDVSAPPASPADPLTLTFLIHESVVPPGVDINSIQLFKDGVVVPACTGPPGVASPDPCVVDRQYSGGVFQITALSSTASIWSFGFPICNDGLAVAGEQCDDGNYTNGDGCSYSCEVETGWDCSGSPSVCMPTCGDGIVLFPKVITQDSSGSTGEQCDDGNLTDGDGCDSNCDFTPVSETVGAGGTVTTDISGMGATAALPVQTYVTTPDGGTVSITVENGVGPAPAGFEGLGVQFDVSAPPASPADPLTLVFLIHESVVPPDLDVNAIQLFKDGIVVPVCTGPPGTASPDPCVADRQYDSGVFQITALSSTASIWSIGFPICGDGIVVAGEQCDDGNFIDGDGCSFSCTVEPGWDCTGSPSDCMPVCGDGIVVFPKIITEDSSGSLGEQCDDGNLTDGDGCDSNCDLTPVSETVGPGGTLTTDISGQGATAALPVQASVTTPDGGTVSITVQNATLSAPTGFTALNLEFHITAPPASPADPLMLVFLIHESMVPPGMDVNSIQLFKDGAMVPECTGPPGTASPDPCVASRQSGGGVFQITVLTSSASIWSFAVPVCGDNVTEPGEDCDDGNTMNGDCCSSTCQFEAQGTPCADDGVGCTIDACDGIGRLPARAERRDVL